MKNKEKLDKVLVNGDIRGMYFVVQDQIFAKRAINILERDYGFILDDSNNQKILLVTIDLNKNSILLNRSPKNGFYNIPLSGKGFDKDIHAIKVEVDRFRDCVPIKFVVGRIIDGNMKQNKETKKSICTPKFKEIKITKRKIITINGKKRMVTIAVLNQDKLLKAGYSVCMPREIDNEALGNKIALGRANSPKTNLLNMELGKGLDRKFIFYTIAEDLFKKIELGVIKINGVK